LPTTVGCSPPSDPPNTSRAGRLVELSSGRNNRPHTPSAGTRSSLAVTPAAAGVCRVATAVATALPFTFACSVTA